MVAWTLAPNVASNLNTVKATIWMKNLGTIGDPNHFPADRSKWGDHTYASTHVGKYGYPTIYQVHAQDIWMTDANLAEFERWVRNEWRAGRANGLKYINVLNRHWNLQTFSGWNAAKAGTIVPRYSGDHHLHISYENGTIDSDLLKRFINRNVSAGPKVRPAYIGGVRRLFDPNRVYPHPIRLSDGSNPFTNFAGVPSSVAAGNIKMVRGFGGPESELQQKLAEYIVVLIGKNSSYWAGRLSPWLRDPARREFADQDIAVFKEITLSANGKFDPNYPLDTFRAFGHTDTWW